MTSTYFDTSAIVRLLVRGRVGHQRARTAWLEATDAASVSITYAEARAALAMTHRQRDLSEARWLHAKKVLESLWSHLDVIVDIDHALLRRAGQLAERESLRGYDAVQLAAACEYNPEILVSADKALNAAAKRRRIRVLDLNSHN